MRQEIHHKALKDSGLAMAGMACCTILAGVPAMAQVPICPDTFEVSSGFKIPYCRNYPQKTMVNRVVIAIHGAERQAMVTYASALDAAVAAGQDASTYLLNAILTKSK